MKRKHLLIFLLFIIIALLFSQPVIKKLTQQKEYEIWEQEIINIENDISYMEIFVDIIENRLYVIRAGKIIKEYLCATGKSSTPSPVGKWIIVSKDTWGEGFGGRWMGLNVPWGKYGIHGTIFPNSIGSAASKGCIRMNSKDVAELYTIVRYGTPVTIYGGPYGPFGRGFRNLKPGDIGSDVLEVQKRLKQLGYYKGSLDGRYGSALESSIYKLQKDKKISKTKIIGLKTYSAMGIILFE